MAPIDMETTAFPPDVKRKAAIRGIPSPRKRPELPESGTDYQTALGYLITAHYTISMPSFPASIRIKSVRVRLCLVAEQVLSVTPSVVEGSGRDREVRRLPCQMSRLCFAPLDITEGKGHHGFLSHTSARTSTCDHASLFRQVGGRHGQTCRLQSIMAWWARASNLSFRVALPAGFTWAMQTPNIFSAGSMKKVVYQNPPQR